MPVLNTQKPVGQLWDGDSYKYLTAANIEDKFERFEFASETGVGDWEAVPENPLRLTILPSGLVYMTGQLQTSVPSTGGFPVIGTLKNKFRPKDLVSFGQTTFFGGAAVTLLFSIDPESGNILAAPDISLPSPAKFSFNGISYIPQQEFKS